MAEPQQNDQVKKATSAPPSQPPEISVALAVGVAIVIAGILVALAVLAYQNSNITTDVEPDEPANEETQIDFSGTAEAEPQPELNEPIIEAE